MWVVRAADRKQFKGDETDVVQDDEVLTSALANCDRNRRLRCSAAVSSVLERPAKAMSRPTSWVSTSVAISVLLLVIAVGYREWSSTHAAHPRSTFSNAFCDHLKSEISQVIAKTPPPPPVGTSSAPCSGHGTIEVDYETGLHSCRCHQCFTGRDCSSTDNGCTVDAYQGDPTMFEDYWLHNGDESSTTEIFGWQQLSYYANSKQFFFVQTQLDQVIRRLHDVVGNAVTDGRHIVIGVGSTQLLQAALYALSSPPSLGSSTTTPMSVVSEAPYYSAYPMQTDYLKSGLYRWAGDAAKFKQSTSEVDEAAYIELITSPSNPTGEIRKAVVNGTRGVLVHDLAYYWPHYVPITAPADDDLMLFTMSKNTGHAGTRIGWAIVKDLDVAKRMAKFIELNSIGVSKDAQIRSTQILRSVIMAYKGDDRMLDERTMSGAVEVHAESKQGLFHFGASEMAFRWRRLRYALASGVRFSLLPEFESAYCAFFKQTRITTPAFAWLRCNEEEDCEKFLGLHGILTRGGFHFGADASFVRISMVDRRSTFEILIDRLEALGRG
ncbi:unnamed protein product [Calypogeia fissa]